MVAIEPDFFNPSLPDLELSRSVLFLLDDSAFSVGDDSFARCVSVLMC